MRSQKISSFLLCFILLVFCITGIYQTYDLTDSLFVCDSENYGSICEKSFMDHSQIAYIEEINPLLQLTLHRKESDTHIYDTTFFYSASNLIFDILSAYTLASFADITHENCMHRFCNVIIMDYVHQIDGEKIA